MDTEDHEMYPNAPVAMVTVEITFPGEIGVPVAAGVQRAVGEVLGDDWVVEPIQPRGLTVNLGPGSPLLAPTVAGPGGPILRFTDRERSSAIAFTSGSVAVETVRYGNWPSFRTMVETAVRAAEKLLRPTGVLRTGLRYIDEVRVAGTAGAVEGVDWVDWLSPTAMPPATDSMIEFGWPPSAWQGFAQYILGDDRHLTLRYGPQAAQPGFVVQPDGPLRRPGQRPEGPFFMLDFDASWQPAVVPRWDSDMLLETCDQLRQPVRALFDRIVTERLVEDVFKKAEGGK